MKIGGACTLELYSTERYQERLGGQLTVGILKPTPQPASFDAARSGNLSFGQMAAYRYTVLADGRYLLRAVYGVNSPAASLDARICWSNTSLSSYTGEFNVSNSGFGQEAKGLLNAGDHTLTLHHLGGTRPTSYTVLLVTLEPPLDLTLGGATLNGNIDVAGERDYYRVTATAGQAFTVNVSHGFSGTVRVYPLPPNGDYTAGAAIAPFNPPKPLGSYSFITPSTGTYLLEVDGTDAATGSYSVSLSSPW